MIEPLLRLTSGYAVHFVYPNRPLQVNLRSTTCLNWLVLSLVKC